MRDLAIFLITLMMLALSFRYTYVAILIWIWTAILSPNDFVFGFMSGFPIGKVISLVAFFSIMANKVKLNAKFDRTFKCLTIFLISATISAITNLAGDDGNWDLYSKLVKIMILAFLIFNIINTRVRIQAVVWAICLALGFHGSTQGLMYLTSGGGHKILGVLSIGDNNAFALAILMGIPPLYYLGRYSASRLFKLGIWIGIGICLISVVGTYSRGGLIGMFVLGLMVILNSQKKLPAAILMIIGAATVYAFAPPEWFARVDTIKSASDDSSFMGRVIAWKLSTLLAMDHPIFGGGFHAIQNLSVWLRYTTNFASLDFIKTDEPDPSPHAAHSIYFEVLGDLGFLGLVLFILLLIIGIMNAGSIKRLARGRADLRWAYDLANMFQISLIVYCVCGALLSQAYFEPLYIIFAVLARLRIMMREEKGLEAPAKARKLAAPLWQTQTSFQRT